MTGFEPRTSGVGSNRTTNSATTTALTAIIVQYSISIQFLLQYIFNESLVQFLQKNSLITFHLVKFGKSNLAAANFPN